MRKNLEGKKKGAQKMKLRPKYYQVARTPYRRMIKKKNIIKFNRKQNTERNIGKVKRTKNRY